MTDSERLSTALVVTLFFHFMALQGNWGDNAVSPAGGQSVTVNIASAGIPAEGASNLVVETTASPDDNTAAVNRRRQARRIFEQEVSDAVHARRLRGGQSHLIGVAVYSFVVEATGEFSTIVLEYPSGKADVDAAVKQAITAASGVVKRPPILGQERIQIILPVKFQHNLR